MGSPDGVVAVLLLVVVVERSGLFMTVSFFPPGF